MRFTDELFRAAQPSWQRQLAHPFVRGVADGSLPEEIFRRWVLQDHVYLTDFSRVFAWAAAKADRLASMTWYAGALNLTLAVEMDLHRKYAARFGVAAEELERQEAWPTTRAYTDFLLRTAAEGDMADVVAALLPCVWGYVWLAGELSRGRRPPADQRYADWIAQYTSPDFVAASDWLRAELDRLAAPAGPAKRRRLTELFLLSSRYEWQFWEMCWRGEAWPG